VPGVVILGASRSGTSMTAGLFAQHGVFFGTCMAADDRNPKGYFENRWWKQVEHGRQRPVSFDMAWKTALRQQGWDGRQPWGAKVGAQWFDGYWRHVPDIAAIVCCYRPQAQIEASRADAGFNPNRQPVPRAWSIMDELAEAGWPVVKVWTDRLVAGELDQIRPAFDRLGLTLDEATAREWIDPALWKHGSPA
jgi:hypothetical protein